MLPPLYRIVLLVLGLASISQADPWSVKLGYPPGQRVVILDARELGIAWEFNAAAANLLEAGHITSASAVATGPWFRDAVEWSKQHADVDLGLSIALTNPYDRLSWRLMTSELGPTTLVNADGFPWRNVVQLVVNVTAEDVQRELDAQIRAARLAGLNPSHLSGYYGTGFSRPDLTAVFLGAAQKYWIPAPVVELTPDLIERFRRAGYPVDEQMIRLVSEYPMPKVDDLQVLPLGNSYEETRDLVCQFLGLLNPGLTHIICRPSVPSAGLLRLTPDGEQRIWTAQALADPQVAEVMKSEQIIMTTWREIMQRFEQGTPRELNQLRTDDQSTSAALEAVESVAPAEDNDS